MAAKRMELMLFAQISSRLGGAFIILMASVLVPFFSDKLRLITDMDENIV